MDDTMPTTLTNYDGSITTSPQQLVFPETVAEIQAVLKDKTRFPSPVRAMGSHHSLTPCAASNGTIINMSKMTRVVKIDEAARTITAEAGLHYIDANRLLRKKNLQFLLNIEIGNLTLGSAACCHTKDGLDGKEFGQVSSYVTAIKWVNPAGDLEEASETKNPELLRKVRSSYGLCGVIYEVTLRVKPMEAAEFKYNPRPVKELTDAEVKQIIDDADGLVCWTVARTACFQTKKTIDDPALLGRLQADTRRRLWNNSAAFLARAIAKGLDGPIETLAQDAGFRIIRLLFFTLEATGGLQILDADKTIDYRKTEEEARYAFTFWAFPRDRWLTVLREYLDFADAHHKKLGFRCNMPLGSYFVKKDDNSLLSYSGDGDVFSIDPIHATSDQAAWDRFLKEFNEFAAKRNGIPLLNQSPFINRQQCEQAYGARWTEFSQWVNSVDPDHRMVNPFFKDLLS
jgi:UDP-N-acetylenolpyruvoylglucosamine reductase